MSLIKKISLEQTVDYSDNELEYFEHGGYTSMLSDYQQVTDKIRSADKSIRIATTSEISDDIYDALHQNSHANIYLLFKSFQKASRTLSKFDSKKPVVAREVGSLSNDFIIIDDVSYLMVNPLSDKDNLFLSFDEDQTQDLNFIFNYLFWNCATLEKLIDKVSGPIESPFPPFDNRKLNTINLTEDEINPIETLFIPRDKGFSSELEKQAAKICFSNDIKKPIYETHQHTQIGRISIKNKYFDLQNHWMLKKDRLSDISTQIDIIPLAESWSKTLNISTTSAVKLKDITAKTIDEMNQTKPAVFPEQKYTQASCFNWGVLPPAKSSKAKKSSLYSEYTRLASDFSQQLTVLEKILNDVKQQSNLLSSFMGVFRKTSTDIAKLAKYREIKLEQQKPNDLRELFTEFKAFFTEVIDSQKRFKNDKQKQQAQQQWEQAKKDKNITLDNKQKEIEALKERVKTETDKNKLKKLKTSEKNLERTIGNLKKDIADNYTKFIYRPKKNEISNLSKEKAVKCKEFAVPRFALPETGVLYETNECYYLEINDDEQLYQAKELAKRYNDKNYQVVVGEGNE